MGIRPNIELAKEAGIRTNQGVVVNDFMQTSDDGVYAVGECIEHDGQLFGLVAPAYEQAKVCAKQLVGQQNVVFERRISATILKVTGIDLFSVGNIETDADCQEQLFVDNQLDIYRKLIIKNQKLIGAILYGDTEHSHCYTKLISDNVPITPFRNQLLFNPPEIA
jgi:nitrite reductase (NADH) large subunit